jgi:hypothetical protein
MHVFLDGDGAADRSSSPGKFAFRTATVLAPAACAFVSEAAMLATHGAENYGTVNNTKFAGVETFRGGFPEPGGNWPCGIGPVCSLNAAKPAVRGTSLYCAWKRLKR